MKNWENITLIKTENGKVSPFTFKDNNLKNQYIEICEKLWGCVPFDVNWAMGTNLYKQELQLQK